MCKCILSKEWEANKDGFEKLWDLRLERLAKGLLDNSQQVLRSIEGLDSRKLNVIVSFMKD